MNRQVITTVVVIVLAAAAFTWWNASQKAESKLALAQSMDHAVKSTKGADWSKGAKTFQTLPGRGHGVYSVAFSPDGNYLATGSKDNTAKLWAVPSGKLVKTLTVQSDWVNSIAFSTDGKYFATGGYDGAAIIWELVV